MSVEHDGRNAAVTVWECAFCGATGYFARRDSSLQYISAIFLEERIHGDETGCGRDEGDEAFLLTIKGFLTGGIEDIDDHPWGWDHV